MNHAMRARRARSAESRLTGPAAVGLAAIALLLACSPLPDRNHRFGLWAKYVSREARDAARGGPSARPYDQVERLRAQFRVSDRELQAILAEARAESWQDLPECQPAPEPYFQHELLLAPEPEQALEGVPTPEACARGLEGVVIVRAVILRSGRATDAEVVKGIEPTLDQRAADLVESSRWLPALLCARPADVYFTVAISYRQSACADPERGP